jgi:hypothetical protein
MQVVIHNGVVQFGHDGILVGEAEPAENGITSGKLMIGLVSAPDHNTPPYGRVFQRHRHPHLLSPATSTTSTCRATRSRILAFLERLPHTAGIVSLRIGHHDVARGTLVVSGGW